MELLSLCSFTLMIILITIFTWLHLQRFADAYTEYETCSKPFKCGTIGDMRYPFYNEDDRPEYCGYPGFRVNCSTPIPEIAVTPSENYYLVSLGPLDNMVTVARKDYWDGYCPKELSNTTINITLFFYDIYSYAYLTLYYECLNASYPRNQFRCANISSQAPVGYFVVSGTSSLEDDNIPVGTCKTQVIVPFVDVLSFADRITDTFSLMEAFRNGFRLVWKAENSLCEECTESGGVCGQITTTSSFTCYCPDRAYDRRCPEEKDTHKKIVIGAVGCLAIGGGMLVAVLCYCRRSRSSNKDIEAFLRSYGSTTPIRYTYKHLKKITNSFKERLGEGGYGTVYKGKLPNDSPVAVKLLKKSKGNAEEFINEVASIGRTNHVNIVKLLGFCVDGHKRALVYDFMPRGSLDKFIYHDGDRANQQSLAVDDLFRIVVGIARGLEYLHQGCNTRILHFDIKPHNILLDENLCPKISDFGLAKPCMQKESIISMSGARGTIGYIAPEVFLRNFGGVSYKSDVYSYGMLVLEMLGCRRSDNAKVECNSEEYFPQWIYNQLEQGHALHHEGIMNRKEKEMERKMVIVSLWCIQTNPSSRPTMTSVVEMLEGTIESLQVPPMPSLVTPSRSRQSFSTILATTSTSATTPLNLGPIDEDSTEVKM